MVLDSTGPVDSPKMGPPKDRIPGGASLHLENFLTAIMEEVVESELKPEVYEKLKRCYEIAKYQNLYLVNVLTPESELQLKIREEAKKTVVGGPIGMMSGHHVGQLLKSFAEMIQAKNFLEIGLFVGYGAVTMAETRYCEKVTSLEINVTWANFVKDQIKGTPVENKIRPVLGKALDSLKILKGEEGAVFDMVFIDADKETYPQYYKYLMDYEMVRSGGLIVCDNILWGNETCFPHTTSPNGKALQELTEMVKGDKRVDQLVFPIRDGLMLIRIL